MDFLKAEIVKKRKATEDSVSPQPTSKSKTDSTDSPASSKYTRRGDAQKEQLEREARQRQLEQQEKEQKRLEKIRKEEEKRKRWAKGKGKGNSDAEVSGVELS